MEVKWVAMQFRVDFEEHEIAVINLLMCVIESMNIKNEIMKKYERSASTVA